MSGAHTVIPRERVKGVPIGKQSARLPRRGDLCVHVNLNSTARIGAQADESLSVRIGVVTSVSRAGQIKRAWFPLFGASTLSTDQAEHAARMGGTLHYVAAERFNVAAILNAYQARRYPTAAESDMVPPFSDNADARALITAHRIAS